VLNKWVPVDCPLESLAGSWDGDHTVLCRDFGLLNTARGKGIVRNEVACDGHNDVEEVGSSVVVVVDEVDTHVGDMVLRSSVVVEDDDGGDDDH